MSLRTTFNQIFPPSCPPLEFLDPIALTDTTIPAATSFAFVKNHFPLCCADNGFGNPYLTWNDLPISTRCVTLGDWPFVSSVSPNNSPRTHYNILFLAESVGAYADLVSHAPQGVFEYLRDPQWWKLIEGRNIIDLRTPISFIFQNYLLAVLDENHWVDDQKWDALLKDFILYTYACRIQYRRFLSEYTMDFQNLIASHRMLRRLIEQGLTVTEARKYWQEQQRFPSLLVHVRPFNPMEPLHLGNISPDVQEWVWNTLLEEDDVKAFVDCANASRTAFLEKRLRKEDFQKVLDLMRNANINVNQRRVLFNCLKRVLTRVVPPLTPPRRLVVWNPMTFFNEDGHDIVIHPDFGEGVVRGDRPDADKMTVSFREWDRFNLITVDRKVVARLSDRERYTQIFSERMKKAKKHVYAWVALAIVHYLYRDESQNFLTSLCERLKKPYIIASKPQFVLQDDPNDIDIISEEIDKLRRKTGIDPIAFVLRMMVGEMPQDIISPSSMSKRRYQMPSLNRHMTPELIRALLLEKPWQARWQSSDETPNVMSVGHFYPHYYQSERPQDLTELYSAFREKDAEAIQEVTDLVSPLIHAWLQAYQEKGETGLVIPMIGSAPNEEVVTSLGVPTLFPWIPRPLNYGAGIEGKRASEKWQKVTFSLRLRKDLRKEIYGKDIVLFDDNTTDDVTGMVARMRLLEAGARRVGLVTLTHTIRHPSELPWSYARDVL